MGMAASQARYLALTARKTNTEYEGQQINQARTALANQSANLFNRLLGLKVPQPPNTTDYTTLQYSFSDGQNDSVLDSWQQLSGNNPDYNYVVTHHYLIDQFTGAIKKLNDPQVQLNNGQVDPLATIQAKNNALTTAKADYDNSTEDYKTKNNLFNRAVAQEGGANIANYQATLTPITSAVSDGAVPPTYTLDGLSFGAYTYGTDSEADAAIDLMLANGALPANYDMNNIYYHDNGINKMIAFKSDLDAAVVESAAGTTPVELKVCTAESGGSVQAFDTRTITVNGETGSLQFFRNDRDIAQGRMVADEMALTTAQIDYKSLKQPTYVGNCELEPLTELNKEQKAEIRQIIKDLQAQDINTANIDECYNAETDTYNGGIYSFKLNGITYYTTYNDLMESYNSGTGNNNIDGQAKLAYYNATYVPTKVEQTNYALLETDGSGRFATVKFDDDSIVYRLNTETITDEAAYQDAMNHYLYEKERYEKTIADINAKTSIIQKEDRTLELRLKQLDTEQNALKTEMDAVAKVIKENVEKTFKTFAD